MHKTIPSVEQLKKENCPAAVALMMYQMYALIPDTQMNADGKKDLGQKEYLDNLVEKLGKVRSLDDFKSLGEFMIRELHIFDENKTLEEQFDSREIKKPAGVQKYRKLVDWLGLELPEWGNPDFLRAKYAQARVQTGETQERVHFDLLEEDESSEKNVRKMDEEEKKIAAEQKRIRDLSFHASPEAWYGVKSFYRKLHQNATDSSVEDWASFTQEEASFVKKFGLKGVRFPYCMSLEERQFGLKDMDINLEKVAEALEMPTQYMGFRGRMPLYYGGAVSGSLGTYTYLTHTLYLLPEMGARATAHEWFHGLDYDLSYQTGLASMNSLGSAPSFSEPHKVSAFGEMKEVQQAMISLLDGLNYGFQGGKPVNAERFLADDGIFWDTIKNVYAKELFRWVPEENLENAITRFNYNSQQFAKGELSPDEFSQNIVSEYSNAMAITHPKSKDLLLSAFGDEVRILSGIYTALKEDPEYFDDEKSSFMKFFCEYLDERSGRQYYTIPTEMIARLGEQYVFDKLNSPLAEHKTPQYAMPFEKEKIMERFDSFVQKAKLFLEHDFELEEKIKPASSLKP